MNSRAKDKRQNWRALCHLRRRSCATFPRAAALSVPWRWTAPLWTPEWAGRGAAACRQKTAHVQPENNPMPRVRWRRHCVHSTQDGVAAALRLGGLCGGLTWVSGAPGSSRRAFPMPDPYPVLEGTIGCCVVGTTSRLTTRMFGRSRTETTEHTIHRARGNDGNTTHTTHALGQVEVCKVVRHCGLASAAEEEGCDEGRYQHWRGQRTMEKGGGVYATSGWVPGLCCKGGRVGRGRVGARTPSR